MITHEELGRFLWRWPVFTAAAILGTTLGVQLYARQPIPQADYPKITYPNPNGFDYFVAADAMLPKQINDFNYSSDNIRTKIGPAFKEVEDGLALQCINRLSKTQQRNAYFGLDMQSVTQQLDDAARLQPTAGNLSDSMRLIFDELEMSEKIRRGPSEAYRSDGIECADDGRVFFGEFMDCLTPAQLIEATHKLAAMDSVLPSTTDIISDEKMVYQLDLIQDSMHATWSSEQGGNLPNLRNYKAPRSQTVFSSLLLHLESPRIAYEHLTNYMDSVARVSSLPWPEMLKRWPRSTDPLVKNYSDFLFDSVVINEQEYVKDRLLETELALYAFDRAHGVYPVTLTELVPAYLPSVPQDPFAENAALQYQRSGTGYLLYSVGAGGVDAKVSPVPVSYVPATMDGPIQPGDPLADRYFEVRGPIDPLNGNTVFSVDEANFQSRQSE